MSKEYYEDYWKGCFDNEGVLNKPPEFNYQEFLRVYNKINKYCGKTILDAGAGEGTFTHNIMKKLGKKRKTQTIAYEISGQAIRLGKKRYPGLKFVQGDITSMPFKTGSFDTVIAIEVVEHLLNINKVFSEFGRVLTNGGYLILTTTDFNLLKKILVSVIFWNKIFYPTNPHIRFFTRETLAQVAKKNNLFPVKHWWNGDYLHLMPKGQIAIFKKNGS